MRLILVICLLISSPALAEKRVAFLVGNAAYDHAAPLDNPVRDTALIADTLSQLNFAVSRHENLTRDQIGRELAAFLKATEDADVTLFYFAGHGMQYEGRNYLIGTDAQLQTEFDIDGEALQLDKVVQLLERNSRAALVFIDACRDNPLATQFYTQNFSQTRALATRGLAPVSGVHQGSMITFSASPGQIAYDGQGANSPFAAALARHLPTENLEVLSLMKRVIRDVKSETGDLQTPMVTNDLTAEIYMKLGEGGAGNALALQQEEALFEAATDLNSIRAWDVFLDRHPNGTLRDMALAAREALQVETIADDAGVQVAELTPQTISRDVAAGIEADLGLGTQDTRAVQAALNRLGYDAGPEDGVLGRRSRQALASYQLAIGLPATGVVTQGTADKLGLTLARAETADRPVVSSRDARVYDPAKLALIESDDRLISAIRALPGMEITYGFFDGRVYIAVLHWQEMKFWDAQKLAEKAGGHLATLTTRAEDEFALSLVMDDRFWVRHDDGMDGPTFGLYQKPGSREPFGGWTWVTGEPFDYANWSEGQPNNHENRDHFGRWSAYPRDYVPGNPVSPINHWVDGRETQWRAFLIEIE